jgi:ActR/RegA family two-component response regulator
MPHPILIVHPDPHEAGELRALLGAAGYDSITVDTVPAGLRILREEAASLVIAASRVNGYNGLQLVAMAPRPIPTIVLAACPDSVLEVEARCLGAEFLMKPAGATLLALVEQKMAATAPVSRVELRRWNRKRVIGEVTGFADAVPIRIVDVSYGGIGFEIATGESTVCDRFRLTVPVADLEVAVDVVWKRSTGSRWTYGAGVDQAGRPAWRRLVDAIA